MPRQRSQNTIYEPHRIGLRTGLPTGYQTLHDLVDAGVVHTSASTDAAVQQHLACDTCGQVTDSTVIPVPPLQA